MEGRGGQIEQVYYSPLSFRSYSQECLLHFSTVPPYLLLKQQDESFMHRKLKNTVEECVDEGSNERKQQDKNEAEKALKEREVM